MILLAVALPVLFGFTISKVTAYAVFLVQPDMVRVIVMVLPRLTGTDGLIVRVYGGTPSTIGLAARKRVRARAIMGTAARSLVSIYCRRPIVFLQSWAGSVPRKGCVTARELG